jgi:FHS family L-fucose permease-like MFS transporter
VLSLIYLVWGAIASMNDLLIPYLKNEFGLSFTQAMRVQLVFYAAYFFLSLPSGSFTRRFGYRTGILTGLAGATAGCLLIVAGSYAGSFIFILTALFVLASGITMLQVSANPYATSMGPEKTAASRLTMVQSFHSLGTTIGPFLGAILIFGAAYVATDSIEPGATVARGIIRPYVLLATALVSFAFLFILVQPGQNPSVSLAARTPTLLLLKSSPRLVLSTLGIFFYVGAEIAIGSFLVNYLAQENIAGLGYGTAGKYVSIYWGLALVGRFIGAVVLRFASPRGMLGVYALVAAILLTTSITADGVVSTVSILSVGFFNSIMFPTIFSLTIRNYPHDTQAASGILCLGIVGGAVVTQLQGILADSIGVQMAFVLPLACYLYITVLAFFVLRDKPVAAGRA